MEIVLACLWAKEHLTVFEGWKAEALRAKGFGRAQLREVEGERGSVQF